MSTVLQQLRAEYEATTPGKWVIDCDYGETILVPEQYEYTVGRVYGSGKRKNSNGRFIINAHNVTVPTLLAVAEAAAAWEAARTADALAMRAVVAAIESGDMDRTGEADEVQAQTADVLAACETALAAAIAPLLAAGEAE